MARLATPIRYKRLRYHSHKDSGTFCPKVKLAGIPSIVGGDEKEKRMTQNAGAARLGGEEKNKNEGMPSCVELVQLG